MIVMKFWTITFITFTWITQIQSQLQPKHQQQRQGVGPGPCSQDDISFELITGFVYSSSSESIATIPATLKLTDCLARCRANLTCQSLNFETGLCVLFSTSAANRPTSLNKSQFPVFTIYAQKICLGVTIEPTCQKSWVFETVPGHILTGYSSKLMASPSKQDCMIKCYSETSFQCRSANYNRATSECSLSEMDRHSIITPFNSDRHFRSAPGQEYIENNCVQEPKKLCDFRPIRGRLLKTVDSVWPEIKSLDGCRQKCLQSEYRCFSFDLNDPANKVCRTSHLDSSSSNHIKDAYFEVPAAITYELTSCYDVDIVCRSRDMLTKVRTNRIFNGKIYGKSKPNSCVMDIKNSLSFELSLGYNDVACAVKRDDGAKYSSEIVLQHHDLIVTTKDLGLSVQCSYDLTNKTVVNTVVFESDGEIIGAAKDERFVHSSIVEAPNVTITVTDRLGSPIRTAKIGDLLTLRFSIVDEPSPYEIFIRSLVASDGLDGSEIELIGADGCPIDIAVMGPISRIKGAAKTLETTFEAFKFPTSDIVNFRAVVTPCLAKCQPIHCFSDGFDGSTQESFSYGKRRRRRSVKQAQSDEDLVVLQSIRIQDAFDFNEGARQQPIKRNGRYDIIKESKNHSNFSSSPTTSFSSFSCLTNTGLLMIFSILLITQIIVLALWSIFRCPKKPDQFSSLTLTPTLSPSSTPLGSSGSSSLSSSHYRHRKSDKYVTIHPYNNGSSLASQLYILSTLDNNKYR
ncbi:uncharacterized protein LOC107359556 isoform X2 [Tetranychus urticae]|uniref:uncharacterized protein LOC107359556 isoform X2 n=1 Tax=Tetranychus urticae TaxID=32264 RepID=UPI000D644024|nr:uncharacterized protein LOC107359556 isoform X2 [Tetranychus urticae]